jgi:type III secretion protein L
MFWLRKASLEPDLARTTSSEPAIAAVGDIVRRESYAALVDIDATYIEVRRQCGAMLADARDQAASILDEARAQADTLVALAEQEYASGCARGEEEGLRRAAADWYAQSAQHFLEQHALLMRMRQRLAELVACALERVAGTLERGSLFARAAHQMEKLIDAGSTLTVRVHPADVAMARREFDACAAHWLACGRAITLQVLPDRSLAPGACLCESDLGSLDASLSTQLSAMRATLDDIVRSMPVHGAPSLAAACDQPSSAIAQHEGMDDVIAPS